MNRLPSETRKPAFIASFVLWAIDTSNLVGIQCTSWAARADSARSPPESSSDGRREPEKIAPKVVGGHKGLGARGPEWRLFPMAMISNLFDKYTLTYLGGKTQGADLAARISCFNAAGATVGMIQFFPDTALTLTNQYVGGIPVLNMPLSRFNDIITTLRYEKPLRISINTDSAFGHISTAAQEPTGEQEAV
jgi:hypothetical protein